MQHAGPHMADAHRSAHASEEDEENEDEIVDELDLYCCTTELYTSPPVAQERSGTDESTAPREAAFSSSPSSPAPPRHTDHNRISATSSSPASSPPANAANGSSGGDGWQRTQLQQQQRQIHRRASSSSSSSSSSGIDSEKLARCRSTTPFVAYEPLETHVAREKRREVTLDLHHPAPQSQQHGLDKEERGALKGRPTEDAHPRRALSSSSTNTTTEAEERGVGRASAVAAPTTAAVPGFNGVTGGGGQQQRAGLGGPPLMPEFDAELLQIIKHYYLRKQTPAPSAMATATAPSPETSHAFLLSGAADRPLPHLDSVEGGERPCGPLHEKTVQQSRSTPPPAAVAAATAAPSTDTHHLPSPMVQPLPLSTEHHQQQQQQHTQHHPRSSLSHQSGAPRSFAPFGLSAAVHTPEDAAMYPPMPPPPVDGPRPPTFPLPYSYAVAPLCQPGIGDGGYGYDARRYNEGQRFSSPPFAAASLEGLHQRLRSDPHEVRTGDGGGVASAAAFRYGTAVGGRGGGANSNSGGVGGGGGGGTPHSLNGFGSSAALGNTTGSTAAAAGGHAGPFGGSLASGLSALSSLPSYSSTSFVRAYVSDISLSLEPAIIVSALTAALNIVVVLFLQHHVLDTRDHLGLFLIGSYMVFASYYMIYYFLERFSGSFRRIASQDKKFYIIGNLIKAGILVSITPFACIHLVKIIVLDEWESHILRNLGCIYAIPDFISMVIVRRMRWSTWVHHACVVVFNYFSIMNNYQHENVCRCVVVYAAFSSFAYCVNVLLASRFLGVSVNVARVLSFVALVVYALCCAVNWAWQVYYLRRLLTRGHEHWTVYIYMLLISLVMWDDIILNRWLLHHARNNAHAASQHLQQHRMRQQQQQQQQASSGLFSAQQRAAATQRSQEERQVPLTHSWMTPRAL